MRELTATEMRCVTGGQQTLQWSVGGRIAGTNMPAQLLITDINPGTYMAKTWTPDNGQTSYISIVNVNTGQTVFQDSTMNIAADAATYSQLGFSFQEQYSDASGNNHVVSLTGAAVGDPNTEFNASYDYFTDNQGFAEYGLTIGNASFAGAVDENGAVYISNWSLPNSVSPSISRSDALMLSFSLNTGIATNSSEYLSNVGNNVEIVDGLGYGQGPNGSQAILFGTPQITASLPTADLILEPIQHMIDIGTSIVDGWTNSLAQLDQQIVDGVSNDPALASEDEASVMVGGDDYDNGNNTYTYDAIEFGTPDDSGGTGGGGGTLPKEPDPPPAQSV